MRQELITNLKANAGLVAALGGQNIYDGALKGARFPHVALGEIETRPWDTQTSRGQEHIVSLHVWSRSPTPAQAHAILAKLDEWAATAKPDFSPRRCVSLRNIFWSALNTTERGLYHGVMRLRIVAETV
jgi:hypothetical protein